MTLLSDLFSHAYDPPFNDGSYNNLFSHAYDPPFNDGS